MVHFVEIAQAGIISDAPRLQNVVLNALSFLLSVFGVVAIIMLVVSGVMYVIAFGDEGRMQKAKDSSKSAVWGVVLVMGSMVILKLVGMFFE